MSTKRSSNAKWLHATTGDYCNLITKGTTPRSGFNSSIESSIPFLRVQNLRFDGRLNINSENLNFVSLATHDGELSRSKVYPGDILINLVGPPLGKVSLVSEEYQEWNINQAVAIFRPQQTLNSEFLKNYLQLPQVRTWLENQSKKTSGQQNLTLETCRDLPLLLPPLPEQRKIAEILSTWDEALEKLDALIEAKERGKKALMQQLHTGQRRITNSLPMKHLKASEIFINRSERNTGNLLVLSVTQDQGVVLRSSLERRIAHDEDNTNTYKVVRAGDYVISLRSFQGGLEYSAVSGAVSPAYHVIRAIKEIDRSFYRHYFKSTNFISRLATAIIGIRDGKQISFTDFGFIKLPYPTLEEQKRIGAILDTADQEITLLRSKRNNLDQQKRGLMQRLLTGRIRVMES
jgi:type I restriction enzyme S subunit